MKKVFYSIFAVAAFAFNSNAQEETKQQEPITTEAQKTEAQKTEAQSRVTVQRINGFKIKKLNPKVEQLSEKKKIEVEETPTEPISTEIKEN